MTLFDECVCRLEGMNQLGVSAWLERALTGSEQLPKAVPDEPAYLAIARLEGALSAVTKGSLRSSVTRLVRDCCDSGQTPDYFGGLLGLVASLQDATSVESLRALVMDECRFNCSCKRIQLSILATLVDTPPAQSSNFWMAVLLRNSDDFAALAFSGILAADPFELRWALGHMPDSQGLAEVAPELLGLTWDKLGPPRQMQFVESVSRRVADAPPLLRAAIREWITSVRTQHRGDGICACPFCGSGPNSTAATDDVDRWPCGTEFGPFTGLRQSDFCRGYARGKAELAVLTGGQRES